MITSTLVLPQTIVEPQIVWEPLPGSQTLALACPVPELFFEGTRGPGKTQFLLVDYAQDVGKGFGENWRGILFRESYPQLSDIIAKSRALFRRVWPEARYNEGSHTWRWPDGEELLFRHMADASVYWDYHGHEYPWIGWEELTNWKDLDAYDAMKACWRSSYPGMRRRYVSNANPFGIGHGACKKRFVDPAPSGRVMYDTEGNPYVRITGHWAENTALLRNDPDYPRRLAGDRNRNRRKAWFLGSWDVAAGGFFDDVWDERFHPIEPFDIPASWRVDRSFDWGSSRPFSVGWWAESDGCEVKLKDGTTKSFPRGSLFRIQEWYGWDGTPNEGLRLPARAIAKGIKEREDSMPFRVEPGPADGSIYDTEPGEPSIGDRMAEEGIEWMRADKSPGSRKSGHDIMREMLGESAKKNPEAPGLWIFNTCRDGFLRTVPTIARDEKKPEDVDTKAEDHTVDESRYRVLAAQTGNYGSSDHD